MVRHISSLAAIAALALAAPAATQGGANALRGVEAGQWELTIPDSNHPPVRMCVADPTMLAQVEHRTRQCTRVTISQDGEDVLIHYTCAGAGFGRARIKLVTPRSLRIETQGISSQLPFQHTYLARRTGAC